MYFVATCTAISMQCIPASLVTMYTINFLPSGMSLVGQGPTS